jgi:adenylylsulfate kinase-like enzyme
VLGTQDPYEAPLNPEVRIDTTKVSMTEVVEMILKVVKGKFINGLLDA